MPRCNKPAIRAAALVFVFALVPIASARIPQRPADAVQGLAVAAKLEQIAIMARDCHFRSKAWAQSVSYTVAHAILDAANRQYATGAPQALIADQSRYVRAMIRSVLPVTPQSCANLQKSNLLPTADAAARHWHAISGQ